jgi:hypothetical protein
MICGATQCQVTLYSLPPGTAAEAEGRPRAFSTSEEIAAVDSNVLARLALVPAVIGALLATRPAQAAPSVWVVDDGEKIRRDATNTPFERGDDNPVWSPGQPVRLFAMRNESVALQVVVAADERELQGVTVDIEKLEGPDGAELRDREVPPHAPRPTAQPIERFVEHFLDVTRPSGGKTAGQSTGWERGAAPRPTDWVGPVPDALVPIEIASASWAMYPMHVEPRSNGIVWVDVNVPRTQMPGHYRGSIVVAASDETLSTVPLDLEVLDATLPDRIGGATVYLDPMQVGWRIGAGEEEQMWRLLHAHRIAAMHDVSDVRDLYKLRPALDGSAYRPDRGYLGPAPNLGDGVLAIGAHGSLGEVNVGNIATVREVAREAGRLGLFGGTDVFVYASDDRCDDPIGPAWRDALAQSDDSQTRRVRVGWTCDADPARQSVDIAMLHAAYDPERARVAREHGKQTWVHDGVEPRTGSFLLDAPAVSPRVNGWIAAMFDVKRWVVGDAARWVPNRYSAGIDPFDTAETFHDEDGDWANGEGVLLYPGAQIDCCTEHSLGQAIVLPSIRLKNWRRGIEDAGYLDLARGRDEAEANRVARWLVPRAFGEAPKGSAPSWPARGAPFFEARRALAAVVTGRTHVELRGATAVTPLAVPPASTLATPAATWMRRVATATSAAIVLLAVATALRKRRRALRRRLSA